MEPRHLKITSSATRPWPAQQPEADLAGLGDLLAAFEPITLAQMNAATLLDRSEIKYVLPQRLLLPILAELSGAYCVLWAADQPLSRYRTLYFDTDDLALYHRHHAGALDRYKVRTREYVDSHAAFLEVKHKVGRSRTVKDRIPISDLAPELTAQAAAFVVNACPYPAEALRARLWNGYTRITLVSKRRPERVTLDLALAFAGNKETVTLPGIIVAEVKYQGYHQASEFAQLMHARHVRDASFSKYCLGVTLLYPEVKHNKFKATQRLVARLAQ
jgi:hypothetical protein